MENGKTKRQGGFLLRPANSAGPPSLIQVLYEKLNAGCAAQTHPTVQDCPRMFKITVQIVFKQLDK
jgi:hypothetical protein